MFHIPDPMPCVLKKTERAGLAKVMLEDHGANVLRLNTSFVTSEP